MTGYGSATESADRPVTVEARSVNSRGLGIVVKGPPGTEALEPRIREVVETGVARGRVDLFIRVGEADGGSGSFELDDGRVRDIIAGLERLRDEFGVSGEVDVRTMASLGAGFRERTRDVAPEEIADALLEACRRAIDGLVEMREREGGRLESDLRERLAGLDSGLDAAAELAPERLERERERLSNAVAELADREFEDDRMAREIALIADRWDVGEELVRARSHVAAFREYLDHPVAEPVGKRLGFLIQELQREINTLGAKANDTRITAHVVEMKNEIEKLREQVENIE